MRSRGILVAVLVLALGATALIAFLSRGSDAPHGIEIGSGPPPEPKAVPVEPHPSETPLVAGADPAPAASQAATSARDRTSGTAAVGEAELAVLVRSRESRAPLPEIRLFLVPRDEPIFSAPRVSGSRAKLGESPTSDAEGRASFAVPAGRALRLHATPRHGASGPAQVEVGALAPGEVREVVLDVPTAADRAFFGRVVDSATGAPVASARVAVRGSRRSGGTGSGTGIEVATGKDGRFELRVSSWEHLHLEVEAPGYSLALARIDDGARTQAEERVVHLAKAAVLVALVLDKHGRPQGDADVRVGAPYHEIFPLDDSGWIGAPDPEWRATTGPDGRCRLPGLPTQVELAVEVLRGQEIVLRAAEPLVLKAGEERGLELRLGGGAIVRGRMIDQRGQPVANQEVWLVPGRGDAAAYFHLHDSVSAKTVTSAEGRFALDSVPVGLWSVGPAPERRPEERMPVVRPTGGSVAPRPPDGAPEGGASDGSIAAATPSTSAIAPVGAPVRVLPDTEELSIELRVHRGLYIQGRVLGSDDEPVAGLYVACVREDPPLDTEAKSRKDGGFVVGPLVPGEWALTAAPFGSQGYTVGAPLTVTAGADDVVLRVDLGGSLRGAVLDAKTGEPCAATIMLVPEGELADAEWLASPTEDGSFRFAGRMPGIYALVARTSDGRIGVERDVAIASGVETSGVRVEVARGAKLRVRWTGAPCAWTCEVVQDGALVGYDALSATGETEIVVPAGSLRVTFASEELGRRESRDVEVERGSRKDVVFE